MPERGSLRFRKDERICSRKLIEQLFGGGCSRALTAFPIRLVYMKTETCEGNPPIQVLISVSKKHFKRAVKRNRVKRQLREAYRKNKFLLYEALKQHEGMGIAMALIWIDNKLYESVDVEKRVINLLQRLAERVEKP
ncbi:MAG: ribonuclease P protein component [Prevotella sp.]|nr:ribonuclease P protein component [Prevotella sp.]